MGPAMVAAMGAAYPEDRTTGALPLRYDKLTECQICVAVMTSLGNACSGRTPEVIVVVRPTTPYAAPTPGA